MGCIISWEFITLCVFVDEDRRRGKVTQGSSLSWGHAVMLWSLVNLFTSSDRLIYCISQDELVCETDGDFLPNVLKITLGSIC